MVTTGANGRRVREHPLSRARELIDILGDTVVSRHLAAGDFAHLEGDDAETVSLVTAGQMLFEAYPVASWTSCPIGVAGAGSLIGEEALGSSAAVRTSSVRALIDVEMVVLYRDDLLEVVTATPRARELLFGLVADRVSLARTGALAGSAASVEVRLARWLLHMHQVFASDHDRQPRIAATQEHLAALAGTRRPTANKALQSLQEAGLVTLGRGWTQLADPSNVERWLEDRDVG